MLTEAAPLTRRNTGAAEQALRHAGIAWGRKRWGNVRVIHELAIQDRRADLVFVGLSDLYAVEIKGPADKMDGRLTEQLRTYGAWCPEVWLLAHPKWLGHAEVKGVRNLLLPGADGILIANAKNQLLPQKFEPTRDDLVCSRLLEVLWQGEAHEIADRTGVIPGAALSRLHTRKVKAMLARMLTGHEIMKQVCRCLRARPSHMTGAGSDPPIFDDALGPLI